MAIYRNPYKAMLDRPDEEETSQTTGENQEAAEGDNTAAVTPNSPEPTWEKRYGDLRSHSQRQQQELKGRITQLEDQLRAATQTGIKLPKTDEELEAWSKQYPDVAAFIETISSKRADERVKALEQKLEQVNTKLHESAHDKNAAILEKLHPDVEEIKANPEFHAWAQKQSKLVQRALYEEDDPHACAQAIDLWKAHVEKQKGGRPQPKPRVDTDERRAAAELIPARKGAEPAVVSGKRRFKESEIAAMNQRQYEALEDEINEANREGRIDFDITGGQLR